MKLKILTPDKLILDQEIDKVTLPGTEGEMTILPMHAAMVAMLRPGRIKLSSQGKTSMLTIEEGYVEVLKNQVLVMTKALKTVEEAPSPH